MDKADPDMTAQIAARPTPFALPAFGRTGLWILAFAITVVLMQAGSLVLEVIDWDESTFALMAQDVLRGHLPYLQQFDNKPPGMFLLLAGAMTLFGESLVTVRLTAWAMLLACGVLTFVLARRFAGPTPAGLATLVMIAATVSNFGLHANTEIPAITLVLGALWLMLAHGEKFRASVGVGLCLCLATLFRTNLGFLVPVFGLFYLAAIRFSGLRLNRFGVLGLALGGLPPVLVLVGIYAAHGALDTLVLSTVTVPLIYSAGQLSMLDAAGRLWLIFVATAIFFPAVGLFFLLALAGLVRVAIRREPTLAGHGSRDGMILSVVATTTFLSMLRGGAYSHYILQLYPFAALAAAMALAPGYFPWKRIGLWPLAVVALFLGLALQWPASQRVLFDYAGVAADYPLRQAADAIAADMQRGDQVWSLENHLVNFYLDLPPVSRADTHPGNIQRPEIAAPLIAAGYIPEDEFGAIIAKAPRYVVTKTPGQAEYLPPHNAARLTTLLEGYELWFERPDVQVYRRR